MRCEGSDSKMSSGVFQEESHEKDSDSSALSQRSPETFTLDVLVSLLRQENAVDICVIKVPEQIKYTEYFIVVGGVSSRHLRAMALYAIKVYKFLKKEGNPNVKIEGKDAEDWMCIDFGNMVVHFMLPETREVYELEKLWTLRTYDEQLKSMPAEMLPEDFIYDVEVTKWQIIQAVQRLYYFFVTQDASSPTPVSRNKNSFVWNWENLNGLNNNTVGITAPHHIDCLYTTFFFILFDY